MTPARSAHIALVEDDPVHATIYSGWLEQAGHRVSVYGTATEFRRRLGAESVDALVLDWTLPDATGMDLLDWLKHSPHASLPVIFLTGNDDEADVVAALRAGAEDYVAKPARMNELIARIESVLRRAGFNGPGVPVLDMPPFRLEPVQRRLYLHGVLQDTTDREFELLAFLFRRAGRIVSRESLLAEVWNLSADVPTRTIDTHVSRLRKKLGLNGESGWKLSGVYQHGYRLEQLSAPDGAAGIGG